METLWTKEQTEALAQAGFKFTPGGSHISRTIMLAELKQILDAVPSGSPPDTYRSAILTLNVLGKATDSTRQKSLRHLRELYALDEATPIFGLLRKLHADGRREPAAAGSAGGLGTRSAFASHDPARHGRIRGRTG